MEEFLDIIIIVWSILGIILFFKIWGMTNNVAEIKRHITQSSSNSDNYSTSINKTNLFKIGDIVTSDAYYCEFEIVDINKDGSYVVKDRETDEVVGTFKEKDLKLK